MASNYFEYDFALQQRFTKHILDGSGRIGARMMDEFIEWCEERGYNVLDLFQDAPDGTMRLVFPTDDAAFEFKMRWL